MRKVHLTVKATVSIPVTATFNVIAMVDDGAVMKDVARNIINGNTEHRAIVEDVSVETVAVDGAPSEADLQEQVSEYLTSNRVANLRVIDIDTTDSR